MLSPEFIYTIGPGGLMPDDRRFGVVWMAEEAASAAFGLQGAFNDLALGLARGASEAAVIAAVDRCSHPTGAPAPMAGRTRSRTASSTTS